MLQLSNTSGLFLKPFNWIEFIQPNKPEAELMEPFKPQLVSEF